MAAACLVQDKAMPDLDRGSSYIAVMIDDLVLHGVTEPYRMLTSRAEYRLRLRADNASTRLTADAVAVGCVGAERRRWFDQRQADRKAVLEILNQQRSSEDLIAHQIDVKRDGTKQSLFEWLRFPNISIASLELLDARLSGYDSALLAEIEEDARYAPYLDRQEAELKDLRANERVRLTDDIDYAGIAGLSNEMVERLQRSKPDTLAAAGRVRGITPAALAAILVHARRRDNENIAA